jgi:hypothetical protein
METPTLKAFAVPAFVAAGNIVGAPVARATNKPVRVILNNDGPTLVFLALRVQSLMNPGANTAQMPPGSSRVWVLAPGDTLFAVSIGAGGFLNGEISEAVPAEQGVL